MAFVSNKAPVIELGRLREHEPNVTFKLALRLVRSKTRSRFESWHPQKGRVDRLRLALSFFCLRAR